MAADRGRGAIRPRPGRWFLRRWPGSIEPAVRLQEKVRAAVICGGGFRAAAARRVAGIDVSFAPDEERSFCAVIVIDAATGERLETAAAEETTRFPYVPGFLSFREGPVIVRAIRKLSRPPDVLLVDGQGIAHPRRCGIASHIGACLDLPSVGCAKSRLAGSGPEPGPLRGDSSPLRLQGEQVGLILRTRTGTKPLFVSIGHRVDLEEAKRIVLRTSGRYRIPEPLRLAHQEVTRLRVERERRRRKANEGNGR